MKYFFALFFSIAATMALYGQEVIPWKYSTPEQQGISSLTLADGLEKLVKEKVNIHSLLVIRNNRIVLTLTFTLSGKI